MPWAKFMIEPVFLCRKPLPPDKNTCYEFDALANYKLSGLIRQLSNLAFASGQVFDEITEECLQMTLRTSALADRIKSLNDRVSKLDAKAVKVGGGLILGEAVRKKHLTISSSRPDSVKDSTDGQDEHLVPVDVSGLSFQRLSSFRRSLIHRDFVIKRAKPDRNRSTSRDRSCRRRNTVSLGRDFSRKSPRNREHLRDPARRRSATEFPVIQEKGAKIGTNDSAIQTDPPDESVIYGTGRVIDLDSNKKSLSTAWNDTLPKITDAKENEATSANGKRDKVPPIDASTTSCTSKSSKSCKSTATSTREHGTNFNAPFTSFTLTSHSSSSLRPSPTPIRSLLDQLASRSIFMNNSSQGPGNKQQVILSSSSPSSPPTSRHPHPHPHTHTRCLRQESSSPSDDEHILTDDHRNNTPVMVKMRQQATARLSNDRSRSKLCHEDGRSSSGNWSASSSQSNPDSDTGLSGSNANCAGTGGGSSNVASCSFRKKTNNTAGLPASILNEVNCLTDSGYQFSRSPSDHSVDDKESFISDSLIAHPTDSEQNTNGYTSDTSALSGLSMVKSPCEEPQDSNSRSSSSDQVIRRCSKEARSSKKSQVQYANRDSESWLQYFEQDGSSDATVTPTVESNQNLSDTDTIKGTNSTTTNLSRRSSVNDRSTVTGGEEGNSQSGLDETLGEEAESVHSMDTDGYYTSMHTDSGLMRGGKPVQLLMTPYSSFRSKNSKRCSIASTGTIGDISLNSVLSNSDMESCSNETAPGLPLQPSQSSSEERSQSRKSHNLNNECTQRMNRLSLKRSGGRKEPPLPPPRTTPSRRDSSSSSHGHGVAAGSLSRLHVKTQLDLRDSHSPSPHATASASESETSECQFRRKQKTTIDSSKYPSLCVVTTSEGSDLNSSDDEGGFDERDEHHFDGEEGEWDLTTNRRVERTHKAFKIKDIFSMKPLDALSKTISKSRESIEGKIRRSFGGHGSSSSSNASSSPKKIPPPTKSKPKVKFHQTLLVPPQTSPLNQFFKRTSDRIQPQGTLMLLDNNATTAANDQDPFSRLFPLRPSNSGCNDVRSPPPLKVDHSSLLRRPASLNLSSGGREEHGPGKPAFTFLSSLKEEGEEKGTSRQEEQIGQRVVRSMKEETPETIVESEGESDYSQRDYLQEILSLSSSPKKIPTVDPVYLKTCYGMSQSAPVTPQIASLAERKAELFKNQDSCPVSPVSKVNTSASTSFCPNITSSPLSTSHSPLSPNSGRKSLLSTDELLHLIYSTKKAANVKTDVECSLAAGGRLMPRSVTPNPSHGLMCDGLPGQRRSSWAGGPPSSTEYLSLSPRRSSIAESPSSLDPAGFQPSKPTTMNDFIRLISAKSSQISNAASPSVPRKSAAELLQVNQGASLSPSSASLVDCATSNSNNSSFNCISNQLPASPVSPNNLSPSQTSCSPPHAAKTRVINGRIYRAPYRLEAMYPTIEELTEEQSVNKSTEKLDNQPSQSHSQKDSNKNSLILLPHISGEHLSSSCINKNVPSNTSPSPHNNENNNNSNINNNNSLCHEKDGHTLHTESEVNIVSDIKNIKAPLADEESLDSLENQVEILDSHRQTHGITVNQERNGTSTWV